MVDIGVFSMLVYSEGTQPILLPELDQTSREIILLGEDVLDAWQWSEFQLKLLKLGIPPDVDSGVLDCFNRKYSIRQIFPSRNKLKIGTMQDVDSRLTRVIKRRGRGSTSSIVLHLDFEDLVDYSIAGDNELSDYDRLKLRTEQIPPYAGEEILRTRLERQDSKLHKDLEQNELDKILQAVSERSNSAYKIIVRPFDPVKD